MDPALTLLILASGIGAVVTAPTPTSRIERLGIVLFHVVIGCVGVGAALARRMGGDGWDDGRALLACAAGPFVALVVRSTDGSGALERWASAWASGLLVAGIVAQGLALARVPTGAAAAMFAPALVAVTAAVLLLVVVRRARRAVSALGRDRAVADVIALASLLVSALCALVLPPGVVLQGGVVASPWALALAVAAAWAGAARIARAPPDRREVAGALFAVFLLAPAVPPSSLPAAWAAILVAVAAGRALWPGRLPARPRAPRGPLEGAAVPGLGGVAALLDDAVLRRPSRPRVLARTPARRIVEAAVERAQRAQPGGPARPSVEVVHNDTDADVDGDPGELAEALCSVIDNALRQPARGGAPRVVVHLRASAQSVSFEVADEGTAAWPPDAPFLFARVDDVDRPGLGVALARARVIVERHGGQLHARPGPGGGVVQLTVPRRIARGPVGAA